MRARGTFLVPTLSAVVDLAEPGGEYTDPRLVDRGREMLAQLRTTVPAAYARGIPIVAGTDTSYTAASLSSVAGEVRLLGQFGLPTLDALRAATTTAATLVGLERELGRLKPGYAADALVVGREPARRPRRARRRPTRRRGRLGRARGALRGAARLRG